VFIAISLHGCSRHLYLTQGFGKAALLSGPGTFEFDLAACEPAFITFLAVHLPQLGLNSIPQSLWLPLFTKLKGEVRRVLYVL
jgi:hypothetical protein